MSKNVALFVDVANLYYSARGQDVDVDYVALLKYATKGRDLIRAYAYSGLDPENENQRKFIDFLGKNGYKVVHKDIRKFGDGRVKANLDIELVVDLFRVADRMDIAVIVSGDGDFAPAIRALQDVGVRCEVISFRPNTSSDLIAVADEFVDIMKIASIERRREGIRTGVPMPEMPAKETTPEFAFREASPAVAAAALAALRTGEAPRAAGPRRARGRVAGRPEQPSDATAAAPEESLTAPALAVAEQPAAAGESEARRRRRRRGGRGRGRGRHDTEVGATTPTDGPAGDIAWEELDDLSQIGDLGAEREYTFEEADAETLAELGIQAQVGASPAAAVTSADAADIASGAPTVDEPAEPETGTTKPRRRRRASMGISSAAEVQSVDLTPGAPVAESPEGGTDAPAPRRRRGRRDPGSAPASAAPTTPGADEPEAKPDEKRVNARRGKRSSVSVETPSAADPDADKPAARRTRARRTPPAADASGESAGVEAGAEQPQGIWQRFRTARGS
ncbi:MAG: hypothetical protein DLM71_08020 [Chloroflexi bacterium]|nr:MAG: hypothetical protein DLM71_08020 [Chloroflexota bacterium]